MLKVGSELLVEVDSVANTVQTLYFLSVWVSTLSGDKDSADTVLRAAAVAGGCGDGWLRTGGGGGVGVECGGGGETGGCLSTTVP